MSDHQVELFEHEKFGSVVGRSMMIHAKEDDLGLGHLRTASSARSRVTLEPGSRVERLNSWNKTSILMNENTGEEDVRELASLMSRNLFQINSHSYLNDNKFYIF